MRLFYKELLEKKMNSFRITNPNIIYGRITNPPERVAASHNYNKQTDMNEVLKEMIFKSKEETIKNMR